MKAVVFHGIGDIRLDQVDDPEIEQPLDAIVRITVSAICGTDLHMVRGTMPGMIEGTILGHEGIGVVEAIGNEVRNLSVGDRVVIPSTVACGTCSYCRAGYQAQCDNANPHGKLGGTVFFGGPAATGALDGMQAEFVRVPLAPANLVKLPDAVSDDAAILISDIFPTGYFGAELAGVRHGDTVAVFGCGPVGQFAIASAMLKGACRIIAVDHAVDRLEAARAQGAECINFDDEPPVDVIRGLTAGAGVDRVIDCVGVDAQRPANASREVAERFDRQVQEVAPDARPRNGNWVPGNGPSQALQWGVQAVAKAGTLALVGVYPPQVECFPVGQAFMKNITMRMGNCNHRRYLPALINLVKTNLIDPRTVLTQTEPMLSAIDAYKAFDKRQPGWMKVALYGLTA